MISRTVINILRRLFATHGIRDIIIVPDNGPQFKSDEFRKFLESGLIRHITSAPFHPSTNGQAERKVRTTKDSLRRIIDGDWGRSLANFLLQQHVTPCPVTSRSPAEMLMNRRIGTLLDRVRPDLTEQKKRKDSRDEKQIREFRTSDTVSARNYGTSPVWVAGTVIERTGPLSYKVRLGDGSIQRRHIDQLRRSEPKVDEERSCQAAHNRKEACSGDSQPASRCRRVPKHLSDFVTS